MKLKYKSLIFLTLLIFCIGSVCAHENHDDFNTTNGTVLNNTTNGTVLNNTTNGTVLNNTNSMDDLNNKYKKLLEDNKELDEQNKKLTNENKILKDILSVNNKNVHDSLKKLVNTKNIKKLKGVKCGKYTFSLDDYLKIPLIKDGKNKVLKYKKNHGRLPNHVEIAGYKVPKSVYKKLYNL